MKKNQLILLLMMLSFACLGQTESLVELCENLSDAMFVEDFDYEVIQEKLRIYETGLNRSSLDEYERCNCADSLWVRQGTHRYTYKSKNRMKAIDTLRFLGRMPQEIDRMNLHWELRHQNSNNLVDSFEYVIQRLRTKRTGQKYLYYLITNEMEFLKTNKFTLTDEYFEIIDNPEADTSLVDNLLNSLFVSNDEIANKILNRIGDPNYDRHFYRMLGIINTSGSAKFPISTFKILEHLPTDIGEEKLEFVLKVFYGRETLKNMKRRQIKNLKKIVNDPKFNESEAVSKLKIEIENNRKRK